MNVLEYHRLNYEVRAYHLDVRAVRIIECFFGVEFGYNAEACHLVLNVFRDVVEYVVHFCFGLFVLGNLRCPAG